MSGNRTLGNTLWVSETRGRKERSYHGHGGGCKFDPYYDKYMDSQQACGPALNPVPSSTLACT